MSKDKISVYMLERYRLGELAGGDKNALEKMLAEDAALRSRLQKLDQSDRELRLRYPADYFGLKSEQSQNIRHFNTRARAAFIGLAAVAAMAVLLPVVFSRNPEWIASARTAFVAALNKAFIKGPANPQSIAMAEPVDRPKGFVPAGSELSVFLKDDGRPDDPETLLDNQVLLSEGSTVQLAYTTPPGTEHYGVIFSIDGRSVITTHYPYWRGQSSILVSGKRTFLEEAYTLDDAPGYEVFVMVVSGEPLDTESVLRKAQSLSLNLNSVNLDSIEEKSKTLFEGCEVETVTVLKK
jgi:hypothetical protein